MSEEIDVDLTRSCRPWLEMSRIAIYPQLSPEEVDARRTRACDVASAELRRERKRQEARARLGAHHRIRGGGTL
jgi:hypothetical protein